MKKWALLLGSVGVAVAVATGIGSRLVAKVDKTLGVRSLETRIQVNIQELKEQRQAIFGQVHKLRSRAGQEQAARERSEEERERLDASCHRLAAKINEADAKEVKWGAHSLNREQAEALLADWGRRVEDLKKQEATAKQKIDSFNTAVAKLEQDSQLFVDSIAKLEAKLNELLNAREVLTVQRQVSEILAAADGRNVPGATAELVTELQGENDRLRGEIAAYGATGATDRLISPDDDLDERSTANLLARYGVKAK